MRDCGLDKIRNCMEPVVARRARQISAGSQRGEKPHRAVPSPRRIRPAPPATAARRDPREIVRMQMRGAARRAYIARLEDSDKVTTERNYYARLFQASPVGDLTLDIHGNI